MAIPGERGHPVRPQQTELFRQCIVIGEDHSPFAGGEILIGEETEAAHFAQGAQMAPVEEGTAGMSRILDHRQVVRLRQGKDGVHVAGITGVMHHHQRAGARAEAPLDGGG